MDGSHLGRLPKFSTIGRAERTAIVQALRAPLSGYIGGVNEAGYFVSQLQNEWRATFGVEYAIACNSATSGLLAACMAIGIGPGDTVWTSAYSMSATAACAKVLGANIVFIDIETIRFSMNTNLFHGPLPKAIIVPNLFGHPACLSVIRSWCDYNKVWMIEDNAQSPFAKEHEKYAGTVGHIGVFSLNVHKHIQCGEGGVICTNDTELSENIMGAINHGELAFANRLVGLNLRMTEPTAAIACSQLKKAQGIILDRIALAEELSDMVADIPWISAPVRDDGCTHVYYVWAAKVHPDKRAPFVGWLQRRGFPMRIGYSKPLHVVFDVNTQLPEVEAMENQKLITFEICAWNPRAHQRKKMRDIICWAADKIG